MKKVYKLEDLDCANCAAKMERAVSFITQKMTIELDETKADEIIREVIKTCKRVEPDCTIIL